ncbi:hypothetical protein SDJN03_07467, partial [Cucurbita argyrosperma subsp. sororia]
MDAEELSIHSSYTGMGSYDPLGKRRDVKHKGRNVVWSVAIDMCLIEVLAMQARNGNIMNRCFNKLQYAVAKFCFVLYEAHAHVRRLRGNCSSRWAQTKIENYPLQVGNSETNRSSCSSLNSSSELHWVVCITHLLLDELNETVFEVFV